MNDLIFAAVAASAQVSNENTKRVLYTLFLIVIIALAFLSFIGSVLIRVTKHQANYLDRNISLPIKRVKVITDQKHFCRYAFKKNRLIFFKEASAPIIIMLVGVIVLMLYYIIGDKWGYNPWNMDTGFGSLLFTWDFSTIITVNPGGAAGILFNWPELTHSPTFDIHNWCGYICCTCWIIGGCWYLYIVQGLMGRTARIFHLRKTIFDDSLENFNVNDGESLENFKQ